MTATFIRVRPMAMVRVALAALVFTAASSIAQAQTRVALVIGNGAYSKVPALPNPTNDAQDIAALMTRLGFSVRTVTNAKFDDMRRALIDFGREARNAEIAAVFFAGHGMEIGGDNWLIPTDAELASDSDAENEAINLKAVTLQVAKASQLGLVILDACRNNPFAAKMTRSLRTRAVPRGLAATEPTENVLVAYAARDGTTANDGAGRNSPFTTALLANLEKPLEVAFLFRHVRDDVMAATQREQQPFVYGSLSKDAIYLKKPEGNSSAPAQVATSPAASSPSASLPRPLPPASQPVTAPAPRPAQVAALPAQTAPRTPSPAEPKLAAFTEADTRRISSFAATRGIVVPPFSMAQASATPSQYRRFVGAWISNTGIQGVGRNAMIVIDHVDAQGNASGFYASGEPTQRAVKRENASRSWPLQGRFVEGVLVGKFNWGTATSRLRPDRSFDVTLAGNDGRNFGIVLQPQWLLVPAEPVAAGGSRPVR